MPPVARRDSTRRSTSFGPTARSPRAAGGECEGRSPSMRLKDKSIIVTGSTTGIGRAIAERCVGEGARVLVHGRDRKAGEAVVASLGDNAALHAADLADPASAPRLANPA